MKTFLILLLLPVSSHAQNAADQILSDREFEDGIRQEVFLQGSTFRIKLTRKSGGKISMEQAAPIFAVTQFGMCSNRALIPKPLSTHYEPTYVDANFRCWANETITSWKERKVQPYCREENIRSLAQEVLCKEMGLYLK